MIVGMDCTNRLHTIKWHHKASLKWRKATCNALIWSDAKLPPPRGRRGKHLGIGRPNCHRPNCIRQRQEKQYTNIHIYIHIHGKSLFMYTEGEDKTSQYSHLVVILSNWFPDNSFYRLPKHSMIQIFAQTLPKKVREKYSYRTPLLAFPS